jgi:hypothetical protein
MGVVLCSTPMNRTSGKLYLPSHRGVRPVSDEDLLAHADIVEGCRQGIGVAPSDCGYDAPGWRTAGRGRGLGRMHRERDLRRSVIEHSR